MLGKEDADSSDSSLNVFINMKMIVFSAKDAEGLVISKTDEHAAMQPALFSLANMVGFYAECNWISA